MNNKLEHKLIVVFSIILILCVVFCGCQEHQGVYPTRIRLAENYNSDWASEAVGDLNFESSKNLVKIAIIDTGCNNESSQIVEKYNVVLNDNNVKDDNGHGSTITQKFLDLNNVADVYIIKVTNDSEEINENSLSEGIYKAIEFDVDVINVSLGTSKDYKSVRTAVEKAIEHNIVVVAASGNVGDELLYPAAYEGVLSVMARDINNLDIVSNCKSKSKLSFSAPGEHILVEDEFVTGSSIAVVYISNAVSYIKSQKANIDFVDLQKYLVKSCDYPTGYSYGMINYRKLQKMRI